MLETIRVNPGEFSEAYQSDFMRATVVTFFLLLGEVPVGIISNADGCPATFDAFMLEDPTLLAKTSPTSDLRRRNDLVLTRRGAVYDPRITSLLVAFYTGV